MEKIAKIEGFYGKKGVIVQQNKEASAGEDAREPAVADGTCTKIPYRFSNIFSRPPLEDKRKCVFDEIQLYLFFSVG